jgi:hypothetical protein
MNELLLKHNLTVTDVQAHAEREHRAVARDQHDTDSAVWTHSPMGTVARSHLCRVVASDYGRGHLRLETVGHAHHLIVVRETYFWLLGEINGLPDQA